MTIHRALVERALVTWLLLRLMVLAMSAAAGRSDEGETLLFFSFAPIPFVLMMSGLLSEVDVRRRHESALLGNLGVSVSGRVAIAVGAAAAGEIALAVLMSMLTA